MKTVIISCRTLEDELNKAIEETGVAYPVYWIESGLHNTPGKLNARLQETLDALDAERVLFAMGYCGNSLAGLHSERSEMIIPKADDCISLLLGSVSERMKIAQTLAAYFLTEGWMRGERNIWVEYQYTVEKYGEKMAKKINQMMYGHYRTLGLLDSGVNDIDALKDSTQIIAEKLDLEQKVIPATLSWMEQLLTEPWAEERFLIVPRGETLGQDRMILA